VKRLCSYLVNARKKPKKKKHDNKYSYNVRYYFTSAKVTQINLTAQPGTNIPSKKLMSRSNLAQSVNNNTLHEGLGAPFNLGGDSIRPEDETRSA
jgi:hypothetical protein